MRKCLCLIVFLLLAGSTQAQTPVALSPVPAQQFLSNTGVPLASGCIYTSISGTSTPLATYTDSTGSTTSPNPVILDAGGYASGVNGTGGLWLSNATYRFQIWSFGSGTIGSNCGNGTLQRTVDGVSAYTIINQSQNLFLSCQSSDPAGSAGELGCRSDLNKIRAFTTLWDSIVEETVTATLTNKTLPSPIITGSVTGGGTYVSPALTTPSINGTTVSGPPATYLVLANDITTGTTTGTLTKMLGATAIIASTTDTGGIIGICVSGCGKTGSATIQQNGSVSCVADGSFTAGDYLQNSATVGGNCHDVGASYPGNGQVVGRAQLTAAGAGTYASVLFGPEIKATSAPVKLQTTSDQTVTGTVMTNVTGMSFFAAANANYTATCGFWGNAVTAGTAQMQWTGPTAPTSVIYSFQQGSSVTATSFSTVEPFVASTTLTFASLSFSLINGANAGTVQLQMNNNTGGDGVLLKAGSYCIVQ